MPLPYVYATLSSGIYILSYPSGRYMCYVTELFIEAPWIRQLLSLHLGHLVVPMGLHIFAPYKSSRALYIHCITLLVVMVVGPYLYAMVLYGHIKNFFSKSLKKYRNIVFLLLVYLWKNLLPNDKS